MQLKTAEKSLKLMLPYYLVLFNWVAATRLKKQDLDVRVIHAHIIVVLTTGALMWCYTIVASLTIGHPLPTIIGIIASLIHLLSPLLFRFSSSGILICSVTLGAGMAHQITFAWFSGGFNSPLLIWLGILPMLAGIIVGRWGVALWSSLTIFFSAILLYLELSNYAFPQVISTAGLLVSQALLVFGWIFLSTVIIVCHLFLQQKREQVLTESKQYINDLLQILTHDLNTPISVIAMALPALQENKIKVQQQAINLITQAHSSMADITEDVRRLYAQEHDEYKIQCQPYNLNQSVSEVSALLQTKITQKRINLRYDFEANESLLIWVDPSIFNHQVMTNILSNAIKFSYYDSNVDITVTKRDSIVRICIQDYGTGMSKEKINQLHNAESTVSRLGTQGEKGTGHGMLIMNRALHKLQGQITIHSTERRPDSETGGTLFIIDVLATK